jgi:TolC family type I secretion outer membrane protein
MKTIIRKTAVLACLALLALSIAAFADSTVISLDSFLKLALENNPQTRIAAAQEASGRAALRSARSGLLPQVGLSAQATRSESGTASSSSFSDSLTDSRGPTDQFSAGISGSQLIYDFGRTGSQISQAAYTLTATQETARSMRHEVLLTAKTAYFSYLLAHRMLDVARESLRQSEEHLLEARTQFEIGKQAKYAVTKAEVDVANARVALIKAQNGIEKARVGMEKAAGVTLGSPLRLSDSLQQTEDSISLDQAFGCADSLRPDLRGALARLDVARSQVRGARATMFPELGATAGYQYRSPDAADWTGGWSAGVKLTQPLYQGGAIRAKVAQAEAGLDQARASLDLARQTAHAEIQQLALDKKDAMERTIAAEKLIAEAAEGLDMSQERYRAGAATFIEVTDAEVALVNARISHAQALYDYRVAHAKLVQAIGRDQ